MREHTTKKLAKFAIAYLSALLLFGTSAAPSAAEEPTNKQEEASSSAEQVVAGWWEAPWRFNVNVYAWFPKAPVKIDVGQEEVDLPESLSNIYSGIQLGGMAEIEVHKGPIGVFASPLYVKLKDSEHVQGLFEKRKVTLEEEVFLMDYGVSYRFRPWHLGKNAATGYSPSIAVEPYGGFRYLHDPIKVKVSPGVFGEGLTVKKTIEFNTPIIGISTHWDLTKRWALRLQGDIGGFHVDNVDNTYQGIGVVGYRFKMWDVSSAVYAGYRYTRVHYDDDDIEIDVALQGPLLGIGWEF
jgi:hypothetical protein